MNVKSFIDKKGVGYITLNKPEIHNAFNDETISELITLLEEWQGLEDLRLVVLQGEGKSFCAGADLKWMKKMKDYSEQENIEDSRKLALLYHLFNFFPRPVIGKVQGFALGGGAGLVSICDYVIAEDSAQFGFTEARLGLVPAVISPYVIRKIGENYARAYFMSGNKFNAQVAYDMQLVHEVVKKDFMEEALTKNIRRFLKAGPESQKVAKELIFKVCDTEEKIQRISEYTLTTIAKMRVADEGQDGMSALLDRRKAKWIN